MNKTQIRWGSCNTWMLVAFTAIVSFLTPRQSQAALSNTLTWAGVTNTNVTGSNNWSASPAYSGTNGFNLSNTIYQYVFTNNYSAVGPQTFSYMNSNAGGFGFTFGGYSNVLVTNVGTFRFDSGGLTATNAGGGTLIIWNTNNSQLTGNMAFLGNMNVWMNNLANHSSTARIVTNNLNLALNNLVVNSMTASTIGSNNTTSMTWDGTGTNTVLGAITVASQTSTNGLTNNAGALIVKAGTMNIATTNAANRSTTGMSIDNSTQYGWNSGLVITNSGSVFVAGQNSLGVQAWNIKMGTTNGGTTTLGLFDKNEWATNTATSVTLTNSFDINNSGAGTNIFRGVAGKTLALSGVIASANTNGTLVFQDGAITLSGANTFSNLAVVANSTVTLSGANAFLGSTNAGIRITGTGVLDLGGLARTNGAFTLDTGTLRNGTLTASSYALTNAGTISAVLAGSGALTKSGAGTAVLSGANTYTGATTISNGGVLAYGINNAISTNSAVNVAGTLDLGGFTGTFGGTNGAVTNNITLSGGTIANGTVSLNNDLVVTNGGTISANITGSAGVTNSGNSGTTLLLSGSNSYTGVTEQRGTTLKIGNAYALGATNGETIVRGGTSGGLNSLDLNGFTITGETMRITNGSASIGNSSANAATWAGQMIFVSATTNSFTGSGGDITVSGPITASASRTITKNSTGTLIFSGANNIASQIDVNAGTLRIGNSSALGDNTTTNAVNVASGATLDVNGYTVMNAGTGGTNRKISIAGNGVGGNGAIYNSSANAATLSNAITMTSNATIGSVGSLNLSGAVSGAFGLTKVGAGTLSLSGNNTYSGGTTISNGAVSISSGNNLGTNGTGGIGSITLAGSAGNTATLMSTLAGGAGAGNITTLTLGEVTMSGNSSLYLNSAYSQFNVTSLALSGSGNQIKINSVGWNDSGSYDLLTSANTITSPSLMSLLIGSTTLTSGQSTIIGRNTYTFTNSSATSYSMNVVGGAFNVIWNGSQDNVWNTSATNWNEAGSSDNIAFYAGDNVTFRGLNPSGGTNIVVGQAITAGAMVVTNSWPIVLTGSNVTASSLTVQKGGNLQIGNGFTSTTDVTVDGDGGSASLAIGGGGAGTLSVGTGKIIVTNGGTLVVNKSSYTLTNQVSGNGNFENFGGTNTVTANNTYTGTTLVAGGSTLMVGNGTAGSASATLGTGDVTVGSGWTLAFNRTTVYTNANNISGQGSVSQLGSQSLELSGSNSFSGGLYLNTNANGTVWATSGDNLGSGTIYAVSANSKIGLSKLGLTLARASMTISNQLNTSLTGTNTDVLTFQPGQSNTYSITLDGQITGSGMLKIGSSASTNSSGALGTGTGNLFVNNTNNNYTGGTELGNGRIIIGNGSALGTGAILFSSTNLGATILQVTNDTALSQNFTLGSTTANSTVLAVIDTANSVTLNGVLSNRASTQIGGLIKTGSGTMTLLGANTYSGGTTVADGTLIGTTASLQGAIANNSAVTFNQSSTGSYTNIMSGTGLLSKSGSGTVTLTRTNSYSGATTVNQGTLLVDTNGSIASSSLATVNGGLLQVNGKAGDVTVNIGGSLGGSGIVGAVNLNRGGLLNPGNSPGTLTATSATISGGSTYNWQISALTGTAGSAWDLFSVSDLLNMTGVTDSNKWNLVVTADGAFTGWTDNRSYEYVFAQAANLSLSAGFSTDVGTDVTSLFNITTSGFTSLPNASSNASGDFKVVVGSANGLTTLNLMAVPEPSTGSMLGLGLAGLVVTRLLRRKNS